MAQIDSPKRSAEPRRSPLRVAGIGLMSALGVWVTAVGTYQVIQTALFPDVVPTTMTCREGTAALLKSLEQARDHVSTTPLSERDALSLFRGELEPVWDQANAIGISCRKSQDKSALAALHSLQLLRYAEERSLRLSAVDLTRLRRKTPRLVQALLPHPSQD